MSISAELNTYHESIVFILKLAYAIFTYKQEIRRDSRYSFLLRRAMVENIYLWEPILN